jgi:CheY-like chemotaxis protein
MLGYDLAPQLRELPGLEEATFISVSGNALDEDKWRSAGIDRHLQKPLTIDSLMGILERQPQRAGR